MNVFKLLLFFNTNVFKNETHINSKNCNKRLNYWSFIKLIIWFCYLYWSEENGVLILLYVKFLFFRGETQSIYNDFK